MAFTSKWRPVSARLLPSTCDVGHFAAQEDDLTTDEVKLLEQLYDAVRGQSGSVTEADLTEEYPFERGQSVLQVKTALPFMQAYFSLSVQP